MYTSLGKLFIPEGPGVTAPVYSLFAILFLMTIEIKQEFFDNKFSLFENKREYVRMAMYGLLISVIIYIGVFDGGQFIYFQF